MRIFVSLLAFCFAMIANAQRKYSDQEIQRLADLGRLWGMLHYFHPKMGTGEIFTDSLILTPTTSLIADPSAANFERCIKDMLSRLNDPSTQLIKNSVTTPSLLFTKDPYKSAAYKLPGGILYVAFPTAAASWDTLFLMPGLQPAQWDSAKAIILDARNVSNAREDGVWAFQYNMPAFVANLLGGTSLPDVYERSIYHNGFVAQGNRSFNSAGWNIKATASLPTLPSSGKPWQKSLLVIFNMGTVLDVSVANFFQSLKAAGLCKIVFEGSEASYPIGKMISINLADSLIINLRASDFLVGNDLYVPRPDWCVDRVTDTSLSGSFIKRCIKLLSETDSKSTAQQESEPHLRYVSPMPGRYENEQLPGASKRLYALYNWWNAIQYFYPYKQLLDRNWDSVLIEYIPRLLNADDTLAYNLALMSMISEITDSHGYVGNLSGATPFSRKAYGYWPPMLVLFLENKLLVVNKANDSLQDMNKIDVWDEITEIDGKKIDKVKKDWKRLFKLSNESSFMTVLPNVILKGALNSTINLGILRNGRKLSVTVMRTGRHGFDERPYFFQDKYSAFQLLEKRIGYINAGKLQPQQIESAWNLVQNTDAIIFDFRWNYGGAVGRLAPRIACHEKSAVMYEQPYVTAGYIKGRDFDSASLVSYYTVKPVDRNKCYKGKVIVLVNTMTQSSGEFCTMLLQAASSHTTVIGSQTAGADGGITQVVFPGGYIGQFTGTSIKYPDGRQTQRTGVKIDIEVRPTIAGFKARKDEVLERALVFIKKGQ